MRNAEAATVFVAFSFGFLATFSAVIFHPASTYGFAQASISGEKAYPFCLSQSTRALAELASSTAALNPATSFSSSTLTADISVVLFGSLQPQLIPVCR